MAYTIKNYIVLQIETLRIEMLGTFFFFLVFTIYMYLYIYFKVVHCTEAYSASYAAPCKYSHTNYCSGCPAWTHVLHTGLAALNSHPEATQPFPLNKACITWERIKLILHTFLTAVL